MKINKITAFLAIIAFFSIVSVSRAQIVPDSSSDGSQDNAVTPSASANQTQDNPAGVTGNPSSNQNQDGGNGNVNTNPSTNQAQDNSGGITTSPSTEANQDGASTPVTPTDPSTPSGGGGTSSGGGSSYSSGGSALISTTSISPVLASTSCNYLTSYLKIDGNNDSAQVTKLQSFLKNVENINVDINGTFDQKTFEGVKAFQAKYLEETMRPWGSVTPSGQVFFTTQKKINEVYCKSPFALTEAQLAQINAYKNSPVQATTTVEGNIGLNSSNVNVTGTSTGTIPAQSGIGSANDNGSQTASAANTSIAGKIWNFIKWLFGYNK